MRSYCKKNCKNIWALKFQYHKLLLLITQHWKSCGICRASTKYPLHPPVCPTKKDNHEDSDIAIIGIGCRLPGKVHNLQDLWRLLSQGVDAIEPLPNGDGI